LLRDQRLDGVLKLFKSHSGRTPAGSRPIRSPNPYHRLSQVSDSFFMCPERHGFRS